MHRTFIQDTEMANFEDFSFHEATIRSVHLSDQLLLVAMEDARVNAVLAAVVVEFSGVHSIVCDGVVIHELGMEFPDGEVLTLSLNERGGELIIEWNDFKDRRSVVRSYTILCEKVEVRVH
jgi:hypothetical protein